MKSWFSRLTGKGSAELVPAQRAAANSEVEELIKQGQQLEDDGKAKEALALYRQALALAPHSVAGFINQGNALQLLYDHASAIESYRQALQNDPGSATAWLNLGNALMNAPLPDHETRRRNLEEAEAAYRAALKSRPDWAEASFGLGCALENRGLLEEASAAYRRALILDPGHDKAAFNLADIDATQLTERKEIGAARQVLLDALARNPGHNRLLARLAEIDSERGRLRDAVALYRKILEDSPDGLINEVNTALLFTLNLLPEITAEELFSAHQLYGQKVEERVSTLQTHVTREPHRRLRIGYVSPDFRQHPVAVFILPVLRAHDRNEVEVYCYHNHQGVELFTEKIRACADHWRDIAKVDHDTVARWIVDDRIDLLIDLAGHTTNDRVLVFAQQPAPVQLTWLGYLGTTGLSRMNYRICDAYSDPPGIADAFHTEHLLRLPDSQWCYEPQEQVPPPTRLPFLTKGYWTFGSYNNAAKLNEAVFAMWAAVLQAFPGSRLRVFAITSPDLEQWVRSQCTQFGITSDRITCIGRVFYADYLASAAEVDISFDTFPYNGGTTTCDNLLMGLPVASVAGKRTISRSGVSLLTNMGLQDWLADSPQDMPALLRRQLADPDRVATLRAELPGRMRASPLMDSPRFTKNLERLYREAWQAWCASP